MISLDVLELLESAKQNTGLDDFGNDDFLEGLQNLVLGINNSSSLRTDRIENVREVILRLLTNRLWTEKDIRENPDILEQNLLPPICMCTLPRTGTTKIQRLLSAIGEFQHLLYWHSHMPARVPGQADGGRAFRIQESERYCDWETNTSPEFEKAHVRKADEPEEETFMMEQTFRNSSLALEFPSQEYSAWLSATDIGPAYDYLVLQLKYLQWQLYRGSPKPWILKSPTHLGLEDQFLRVFPQGRHFLFSHRDPKQIIPSLCHLVKASQKLYYVTEARDEDLGQLILSWLYYPIQQHMAWRDRNPEIEVLDLAFTEVSSDSIGTARKICAFIGKNLEQKNISQIEKWDRENPRHKHGKAEHSLGTFGLTPEKVDEVFAPYMERFANYF